MSAEGGVSSSPAGDTGDYVDLNKALDGGLLLPKNLFISVLDCSKAYLNQLAVFTVSIIFFILSIDSYIYSTNLSKHENCSKCIHYATKRLGILFIMGSILLILLFGIIAIYFVNICLYDVQAGQNLLDGKIIFMGFISEPLSIVISIVSIFVSLQATLKIGIVLSSAADENLTKNQKIIPYVAPILSIFASSCAIAKYMLT